jgi:hypothetical protein
MPVACSIDLPRRRVVLTIVDPYSLDQWRAAVLEALADPEFVPGFGFLVDRRDCSAPTGDFVQRQIDFLAAQEPLRVRHRVAILVRPDDAAAYGMARMLEIRAGLRATSIEHRIFQRLDAAERWLSESA